MKYAIFTLLSVVLLGAGAPKSGNAVTVVVNGEGVVSRAPDTADVTVGIVTNSPDALTASQDNNGRYNDLRNKLRDTGVQESQIRTLSYNVNTVQPEPLMAPIRTTPPPSGFTVSREVQIELSNLEDVGKVIDAALSARVTNVYSVSYTNSQQRVLYAQALRMAVEDARRQAEAMAQAAHLRILRISSLQNGYFSPPMIMRAVPAQAVGAPAIPTQINPGNLDIRATVSATYILGP